MGKHRGRPKARERQELDAAEARELLQQLNADGKLPTDAVLRLLSCDQPRCEPPCKAPHKDNPGCLCGLVPAPGSFRVKGLWRKQPTVLSTLGPDPRQQRRKNSQHPCGLNNLGNTCYVNSALQFLHSIPSFSHALYTLEDVIAEQEIIHQLRDLFIQLEFGPRASVDPTGFARSLQLDHAIQQDGQEFLKLLLAKVEGVFGASGQQEVREVVQQLFKGGHSYITTCQSCHRQSDSSSRVSDYYELSLPVVGCPNLELSMLSLLSAEHMEGDNQYFCDYCQAKRDAQRQLSLRTVPPYLCLSLQRFVFDMKTFEKKKATDKLAFPLRFDLQAMLTHAGQANGAGADAAAAAAAACVGPNGTPAGEYELVAVMIHKGSSASHGHYVAHIKSPTTSTWWRFDDETAEEMGTAPTTHPGDHGTTAAGQAGVSAADKKAAAEKKSGDRRAAAGAKRGGAGSKRRGSSRGRGRGRAKIRRKDSWLDDEEVNMADTEAGGSDHEVVLLDGDDSDAPASATGNTCASAGKGSSAPLLTEISSANAYMLVYKLASWTDSATFTTTADSDPAHAAPSSHAPNGSQEAGAVKSEAADGAAAAAEALTTAEATGAARAAEAMCEAEEAAPAEAEPAEAAGAADTVGGAEVTDAAGNAEAAGGAAEAALRSARLAALPASVRQRVAELEAAFEESCQQHERMKEEALQRVTARQQEVRNVLETAAVEDPGDDGCFISTAWLQEWAGDSEPAPGPIDNSALLCVHGGLDPAKVHFMKRISTLAWEQLQSMHGGGSVLSPSHACVECMRQCLEAVVCSDDAQDKRAAVLATLQAMEAVEGEEGEGPLLLGPDAHYVSKTWLQGWVRRQGSSMSSSSPTANITCPHGRLAPDATTATKRTAVSGEVWHVLCDLWRASQRQAAVRAAQKAARQAGQQQQHQQQGQQEEKKQGTGMSSDDGIEIVGEVAGNGSAAAGAQEPKALQGAAAGAEAGTSNGAAQHTEQDCMAFRVDGAQACPECSVQLRQVTQGVADARAGLEAEREALPTLAANVVEVLEPGPTYYLVPNDWLRHWRQYLGQAGKRPKDVAAAGAVDPPVPLYHAILPLLCECHPDAPGLAVHPPAVLNKRGRFSQGDHMKDALRVISATEWYTLCSFHSGSQLPPPQHGPGGAAPTEPQLAAAKAGIQALLRIEDPVAVPAANGAAASAAVEGAEGVANGAGAAGARDAAGAAGTSGRDGSAAGGKAGDVIMLDASEAEPEQRRGQAGPSGTGPPTDTQNGGSSRKGGTTIPGGPAAGDVIEVLSDAGADAGSEQSDPELAFLLRAQSRRRASHRSAGPSAAHGSRGGGAAAVNAKGLLLTVPGVCKQHMEAVARAAREAALVYEGAEVMVEVVRSQEELAAALQPSGAERKSRRARKGRAPIKVSSSLTLGELKLRMLEALDVHPRNITLYVRGQPAGCDELTLAQAEIFPDEEIRALVTGDHPDDDYASLFDSSSGGKRREVEVGFKNTALTGSGAAASPAAAPAADTPADGGADAACEQGGENGGGDASAGRAVGSREQGGSEQQEAEAPSTSKRRRQRPQEDSDGDVQMQDQLHDGIPPDAAYCSPNGFTTY